MCLDRESLLKKIKNNLEKNDGHYDSEDTYSRCINAVKNHVKDVVI